MFPLSISSILWFPYSLPVAAYVFFLVFPFFCPSFYISTDMTFFCKDKYVYIYLFIYLFIYLYMKQISEYLRNNTRNSGNKIYK